MRVIANMTIFLFLIVFSSSCWPNDTYIVAATGKKLEVKASVVPKFLAFIEDKSKIEGQITIINLTSSPQKYSNKFLILKVNGSLDSRTYKNVIYSDFIDFGLVEIKPQSSLSLPAYWVFKASTNAKVDSVQLFLDEEGVEKQKVSIAATDKLLRQYKDAK